MFLAVSPVLHESSAEIMIILLLCAQEACIIIIMNVKNSCAA